MTVVGDPGGDSQSHVLLPNRPPAGYVHEAVYFDAAAGLVDATAPLLRQALARGEHVALVCSDANNRALAEALGDDDRLVVLPRPEIYRKAITAVAYFRDFVQGRLAGGADRVCVVGEVDFGTDERAGREWRRYEALLNHALSPFPLWSLCGYDVRVLPEPVLATGELTHPYLRGAGGHSPNPAYVDPAELMRLTDAEAALVPQVEPTVTIPEVLDLDELHRELTELLGIEGLGRERVEEVVLAVHEVVANGMRHGEPPVTVRVWFPRGRVVCTVTDRGVGFDDPFAGYVQGAREELPEGRFGLWLARQFCDEVATSRTGEGFVVRLVVHH
jgi:anti-sigma regulatory factor (Ser/Thr protein kinase)